MTLDDLFNIKWTYEGDPVLPLLLASEIGLDTKVPSGVFISENDDILTFIELLDLIGPDNLNDDEMASFLYDIFERSGQFDDILEDTEMEPGNLLRADNDN
jgi:hypothetical protein